MKKTKYWAEDYSTHRLVNTSSNIKLTIKEIRVPQHCGILLKVGDNGNILTGLKIVKNNRYYTYGDEKDKIYIVNKIKNFIYNMDEIQTQKLASWIRRYCKWNNSKFDWEVYDVPFEFIEEFFYNGSTEFPPHILVWKIQNNYEERICL